jgi:hypothetical protein
MTQTQTIPETFLGVGYTRDRAGLPLEAMRVPVPQSTADEVLIRVAASSLNPLEYKLADLNLMGRTPPVVLAPDDPLRHTFLAAAPVRRILRVRGGNKGGRQRRVSR